MKTFGIALMVIGILMMLITGFTLVTKEKVAEVGPIEIGKTEKHPIYWSPVTGAVIAAGGAILLIMAQRKK
jgi:hypothetical protein